MGLRDTFSGLMDRVFGYSVPKYIDGEGDDRDIMMDSTYDWISEKTKVDHGRLRTYVDLEEMANSSDISCLAGDTKIRILDGTIMTIKDMSESNVDHFWLYSYDIDKHKVVPGLATVPYISGHDDIYDVLLDDGSTIRCNDKHPFLLLNNQYVNAIDLSPGDSLVFAEVKVDSYESVRCKGSSFIPTHMLVQADLGYPRECELCEVTTERVVTHHTNGRYDNRPNKLMYLCDKHHFAHHASLGSENLTRLWKTPWFRKKMMTEVLPKMWSSVQGFRKSWSDPAWREAKIARSRVTFSKYRESDEGKKQIKTLGQENGPISGRKNLADYNLTGNSHEDLKKRHRTIEFGFPRLWKHDRAKMMAGAAKGGESRSGNNNSNFRRDVSVQDIISSSKGKSNLGGICGELDCSPNLIFARCSDSGMLFSGSADLLGQLQDIPCNHKVVSVTKSGREDVYDLSVAKHHNFGVVVNGGLVFTHNTALSIYADDSVQLNMETNRSIWCVSSDEKVQDTVNEMFDSINIEEYIWGYARSIAQYGDLFLRTYSKQNDGVTHLAYVNPKYITRVDDKYGMLVDYRMSNTISGRTGSGASFKPWEITHFKTPGQYLDRSYGDSFLDASRSIWKQLKMMEDSIMLYRIRHAPDRMLYKIDVGTRTAEESFALINRFKLFNRRRSFIDPTAGTFRTKNNPLSCFTGDTRISLLNGTEVAIKDLVGREEFWVYSYDTKNNKIVPGRGHSARLTKRSKLVHVTLDNGEKIRCTPDHHFLTKSGLYVQAQHLSTGSSLMPLYRRRSEISDGELDGYDMCHAGTADWEYTHRISAMLSEHNICEVCNDMNKPEYDHGFRHHRDFNKLNNDPDNFAWLTWKEHYTLHAEQGRETLTKWNSSDKGRQNTIDTNIRYREQKSRILTEYNKSDAHRRAASQVGKTHGAAAFRKDAKSPEGRARRSGTLARLWAEGKMADKGLSWNATCITCCIICKNGVEYKGIAIQNHMMKHSERAACASCGKSLLPRNIPKHMSTVHEAAPAQCNHKVLSVEVLDYEEDVYDITVDEWHNFSLTAGIYVKNSDEDIYFPIRQNSNSDVTRLQGSANVDSIQDIDMMRTKLYAALKIPPGYMGQDQEGYRGSTTLAQQDIRYARTVRRLQRALIIGFRRISDIHLVLSGYDLDNIDYNIAMSNVSNLDELEEVNVLKSKLEAAKELVSIVDTLAPNNKAVLSYIFSTVLSLPAGVVASIVDGNTNISTSDAKGGGENDSPEESSSTDILRVLTELHNNNQVKTFHKVRSPRKDPLPNKEAAGLTEDKQ